MKAAVLYQLNAPLVVEEVQLDPPKRGEVMVRIVASGICATDLHVIEGTIPRTLPVVPGHEGAGIIEAVGEGMLELKPGDHVVISLAPNCGHCFYCQMGKPILCENMPHRSEGALFDGTRRLHSHGRDLNHYSNCSTFAEYAVVPERACVKVRHDAPLERLCLLACGVTTGIGAVINTAGIEVGSRVAVFGCGGVGLNVIQGAGLAGAGSIIAVDLLANKLEWARQFGATHTINATDEDPVAAIYRITRRGVDYAFEVIGNPLVLEQAFASTRASGTCVMVGSHPAGSKLSVDPRLLNRDRRLLGCTYGSARPRIDIPMLVEMYMNGKIRLDELVTRETTLPSINECIAAVKTGEVARSVLVNAVRSNC